MRYEELSPIIHYEVSKKYDIDELKVDENKIIELSEQHKLIIEEQNEQAFITFVINKYGDFLSSNQSEAE
jgi:hypothetical protein